MLIRVFLLLQLILYVPRAGAEMIITPCPDEEVLYLRGLTLRAENDSFAKTDRNYSQGLALSAQSFDIKKRLYDECLPLPLRVHVQIFDLITPDIWMSKDALLNSIYVSAKAGQSVYTPRDLTRKDLIIDDRPYAGLLYGGMAVHRRYRVGGSVLEVLDSREITVGVMGPLAYAKEFQDAAHDLTRDPRAQGWSNQIRNEPALQLALDKKFKVDRGGVDVVPGFAADLIPAFGVRLGNIETSANAGFEARVGWDLPNNFGSLPLRPGTESLSPQSEFKSSRLGLHFFTIIDVKFVGYNFSIDGNLFSNYHRVSREPVVATAAFGFNLPVVLRKYSYNLAVMHVYQTSDFKEEDDRQAYRSIALSFEL